MNEFNTGPKLARVLITAVSMILSLLISFDVVLDHLHIALIIGVVAFMAVAVIAISRLKSPSRERIISEPRTEFPRRRDSFPRETKLRSSERLRPSDIICPDCAYENPSDAQFCIGCGRELP